MRAALLALVFSSCAVRSLVAEREPAKVIDLQVEFISRDKGQLAFTLALPADVKEPPKFVSWELLLNGARLATGIDGVIDVKDGQCTVKTPLTSRHLEWRQGAAPADVLLRGEIDLGDPDARIRFRELRQVTLEGQPRLNVHTE
ncbi:MAG: hypothetical protein ACO1OB_22540 [Archangium sp.]